MVIFPQLGGRILEVQVKIFQPFVSSALVLCAQHLEGFDVGALTAAYFFQRVKNPHSQVV
jgi:hypothetical protein